MLKPVETEETLGEAEVRALFRVSRLGTIAGCMVTSGVVRRNAQVRVVRDGTVIYETTIAQLKRFKDDVREVERASSAASCSTASTTSRKATCSRSTRPARSSAPTSTRLRAGTGATRRHLAALGSGYVGILSVELHFPEAGSLKGKRKHLQVREGAAPEPLRRLGRRGRPPRALAARAR